MLHYELYDKQSCPNDLLQFRLNILIESANVKCYNYTLLFIKVSIQLFYKHRLHTYFMISLYNIV